MFSIICAALADLSSFLLNLLPHGTVYDRFVDIFENDPVFTGIYYPFFIFVRFRVGLEIENITAILLQG